MAGNLGTGIVATETHYLVEANKREKNYSGQTKSHNKSMRCD